MLSTAEWSLKNKRQCHLEVSINTIHVLVKIFLAIGEIFLTLGLNFGESKQPPWMFLRNPYTDPSEKEKALVKLVWPGLQKACSWAVALSCLPLLGHSLRVLRDLCA